MNKFEYLRFFYCVKILERIRVLHNPFFFFLFNWDNTYKNATNFAFVERIRAKFNPFPFAFNYMNFILIFIRNDILFWDISLFGFMIKNLMAGMIYRNIYKLHLYWLHYGRIWNAINFLSKVKIYFRDIDNECGFWIKN